MTFARTTALPLTAAFMLLSGAAIAQDDAGADDARLAFNNHCRTCHTTNEGDNRLGPSLYGVVGREAASLPDFAYSSALANADLVWDEETLDRFIENPDSVVSGNNMKPFAGVSSIDERAKIIAHLKAEGEGGG